MKKLYITIFWCTLGSFLFSQTILGIDVSHYQGTINWNLVSASGKTFAYAKATEGMTYTDPNFYTYMANGVNAGLIMGAYHFARPDNNTAIQDANNFISAASAYIGPGFLPPALDIEDTPNNLQTSYSPSQLTAWVQQWMTTVENATGVTPIIYTNANYAQYLNSSINNYGLWIANWSGGPSTPPTNLGVWNDWKIKQYSETGIVSGISGNVDLNVFNGNVAAFNSFINSTQNSSLNCSNAINLSCGVTYNGPSSSASSNVTSYGCNSWTESGPERVHTITTNSTGTITASLSNFSGDLDVYILGSCDPTDCLGTVSSSSATYSNAPAGTYYIVVDADDGSGSSYSLLVNCTSVPVGEDITVSNATVSSTFVMAGDDINVTADQNYSGSQLDSNLPSFDLDYYLSTDCNLSSNDILLGGDVSGLGSDDPSESESATLTIPSNTSNGTYYILFAADNDQELAESNENNNVVCIQITIGGIGGEDITVSNATVSSTTVMAGDDIDVTADQNYSGSQLDSNLPSFDLDYYLSTDCNLSSNDILLGGDVSGLGSDDPSESESATLTIPSNTSNGTYYILFAADNDQELAESNENNNVVCIQITIGGIGGEDITVSNATVSSTTVMAGDDIDVTADQNYSGSQLDSNLPSFDLDYYLSTDCNLSSNDILLGGDVSGLGSDDPSESESATLTIPSNTSNGTYYILFAADNDQELAESNENNNVVCIQITIGGIGGEDITVSNATVSSTTVMAGDDIDVTADQNYSGSQLDSNLPSFDLDYYLSTDCNLSSNDILLGGDVSGLGSDDPSESESATLTIPSNTAAGTYYIIFAADNDQELTEANENNNVVCIPITIIGNTIPEDISVTNAAISTSTAVAGDYITVLADQNYTGSQTSSNLPSFSLSYYLSTDCSLSSDDIMLGIDVSTLGTNNPTINETSSLLIPNNIPQGNYFIIFFGDSGNDIIEPNENNNIICIPLYILEDISNNDDISISNASLSSTVVSSGTPIIVSCNQNYNGSTNSNILPDVDVNYYFSSDCTLSSIDQYLGGDESNLGSDNTSEQETATITIPLLLASGTYYIIISADNDNEVTEVNESNNLECLPITILPSFTGITNIDLSEMIQVYPNPNSGYFTIDASQIEDQIMNIYIYDVKGSIIYFDNQPDGKTLAVKIKDVSNGIYLLSIRTNKEIYYKKLIIRN
jgi:GH25 family lysozyme M1 (1,4-beta-N-acetylmuramidase)/subtilase family serine protease